MSRFVKRKSILSVLVVLALVAGFSAGISMRGGPASHAAGLKYASLADFVKYMNSIHKAPFDRDGAVIPPSASKALAKHASIATWSGGGTNVMVNQDRNPWPKAELGAAVDPTNGNNYVVMANDFREN